MDLVLILGVVAVIVGLVFAFLNREFRSSVWWLVLSLVILQYLPLLIP